MWSRYNQFCIVFMIAYIIILLISILSALSQGKVYTITDVNELHVWMKEHFNEHPLFRELEPREYASFAIFMYFL